MLDPKSLIKFEDGWKFATEQDLEDFLWNNLEKVLNLQPLKRQFNVLGEICDLLGLDEDGNLVIVELKNTEDRYVVQQLTRYYDNLIQEKPKIINVDWSKPIHLIAITPKFHKHNFIDRKHSKLQLDFLNFEILQRANELHFELKKFDDKLISEFRIPYPEELITEDSALEKPTVIIPRIPKVLKKVLDENIPENSEEIILVREKILNFDPRMREVNTTRSIQYGLAKGENAIYTGQMCAQFHIKIRANKFDSLNFYLCLPYPNGRLHAWRKLSLGDKNTLIMDVKKFSKFQHSLSGMTIHRNKNLNAQYSDTCSFDRYWNFYKVITGKPAGDNSLDSFLNIALEEWLERVEQKKVFVICKYYDSLGQYLVEDGIYTDNFEEAMKFTSEKKCKDFVSSLKDKQYKPYCKPIYLDSDGKPTN